MKREEWEFCGGAIVFLLAVRWLIVVELKRLWQQAFGRHQGALRALQQRQALAQIAVKQAEERASGDRHGL